MTDPDSVKKEDPPATPTLKRAREGSDQSSPTCPDDDDDSSTSDLSELDSTKPDVAAPAYDKRFPEVHAEFAALAGQVVETIESSGCDITEENAIYSTYRRACELRKPPKVAKTRAVLLGDSGVGKSSLINALLGVPMLAKAIALGTSVTTVATSYESPLEGQTKQYGICIDYISQLETVSLIKDFLNDYKMSTDDLTDFDQQDRIHMEKAGRTAFEALNHLFYGEPNFESEEALSRLLEAQEPPHKKLIDRLAAKAEVMIQQMVTSSSRSTICIQQDELTDIQEQATRFTSFTSGQSEPSAYPLVKQVRMGIRDNDLLRHFTIVDCPGKSDINTIHANAYHRQLDDCNEVWIVDRADRIETNGPVADFTKQFGKSSKNVVVIGTRADDDIGNGDELLKHLRQHDVDVSHIRELQNKKTELETVRNRAKEELDKAKKREHKSTKKRKTKHTSSSREDDHMLTSAQTSWLNAKRDVEDVKSECLTALAEARSMYVTRRLRERFQDNLAPGKKLEIFFVSNTHYESNASDDCSGALLSVEGTKIPALRQYVHSRAAPKILEAIETYIASKFDPFINGIGMFVDPVRLKGSRQAIAVVDAGQQRLVEIGDGYIADLKSAMQSRLAEPLRAARPAHVDHAKKVLEEKKKWHVGQIRVWVQGNGKSWTKKMPPESWNELFATKAVDTVRDCWQQFLREDENAAAVFFDKLSDTIREAVREIEQSTVGALVQFDRFHRFVDGHLDGFNTAARAQFATENSDDLDTVRLRVNEDSPAGYFRTGLREAYDKCKQISGTGSKPKMLMTLETYLTMQNEGSPFAAMEAGICGDLTSRAEQRTETALKEAHRIFDDIKDELEAMLEERQEDPNELALRKKLGTWLSTGEEDFAYTKATLDKIKRDYPGVKDEVQTGEDVTTADVIYGLRP